MQTSPLAPGSKELMSRSFQIPPFSSAFSRVSLAPTDTITFHSEAQPSEQEPSQASASSLTDCFSPVLAFVQNIPSSLWNFFTGIVSYCLSFCYAQDPLRQEEEAARAFLNTRYEGTEEENQTAFIAHVNALPPTVKEFYFGMLIFSQKMCSKMERQHEITSGEFSEVTNAIQDKLKKIASDPTHPNPRNLRLFVHAWLIQRQLSVLPASQNSTNSSLTDEQIALLLPPFEAIIDKSFNKGETDQTVKNQEEAAYKQAVLNAITALPAGLKTYIDTLAIFRILTLPANDSIYSQENFNDDLNAYVLETINPTDAVGAETKIQEQNFKDAGCLVGLINGLLVERKRAAGFANTPS
jgi:hypothetical protein